MNTDGISPEQVMQALSSQGYQGASPGTLEYVSKDVTVVVDEHTGKLITVPDPRKFSTVGEKDGQI